MKKRHSSAILLLGLLALSGVHTVRAQESQLEAALADLYAVCLFEPVENNPFSQAVALARQSFAPGISNFIESNLASIPLTPPSLDAEFADGEIVTVVTGFTPIFTESSATVGKGQFLVGSNFSYFNLSRIRGEDLDNLEFGFEQNGGGDIIAVTMPFNIDASIFTIYGSYGLTNRLDVGFALPIVRLSVEDIQTTFSVEGDHSGCRYSPDGLNCNGNGGRVASPNLSAFDMPESEMFLNTLALRAKYRFPTSLTNGQVAAVVDMRLPVGRGEGSLIGQGHFGTRVTLIGEYDNLSSFKPYVNIGAQFWNGDNSNSLKLATGFTQRIASKLFFAFDLLGEMQIEDPFFLDPIDDDVFEASEAEALSLVYSTIPSVSRDHTLNAGLGAQFAISPTFQVYGSALFALLDRGLQSNVAPTIGASLYF